MKPSFEALRARSEILDCIRLFFKERGVLEVETPYLAPHTNPDPHIESFEVISGSQKYFLQTSPEFHMKRLIAAGCGSIYQVARVFRQDEAGRVHNPEFSMLEWYRIGFDHFQLMQEVDSLVQRILGTRPAIKMTYRDAFKKFLDVDITDVTVHDLEGIVKQCEIDITCEDWTWDSYLDLLFTHQIEPELKAALSPVFIFYFPRSKASLAKLVEVDGELVAARFELFIDGMEIANGFNELTESGEQRKRFIQDNAVRQKAAMASISLDENFLKALDNLPQCSGVALGLDRLIMLALKRRDIKDVLAFNILEA